MRGNPALAEHHPGVLVSGVRDPFIGRWPSVDALFGQSLGSGLYGVISGGLKDKDSEERVTPTVFLLTINPKNFKQWVYPSAMNDTSISHNISRWSGELDHNWEYANVMTLTSSVDGSSRDYIVVGAEGVDHAHPNSDFHRIPTTSNQIYTKGIILTMDIREAKSWLGKDGRLTPLFNYVSGCRLNHKLIYGVNSFL